MLLPFLLSRALLIGITLAAAVIRGRAPLSLWNGWDARWYLGIAVHGYDWGVRGKPAVAFFPLYPLLVHVAHVLGIPAVVAALLISNAAFVGALFYVYALARPEWGTRAARHAVILLTFFPTAFVTFGPYSESLFLLCVAAALYHSRQGNVTLAGVLSALAVLTRSSGVALIPAVLLASASTRLSRLLSIVVPTVVGVALYASYLSHIGVSPDVVLNAQRAWHRSLTFPWTGFTSSLHWLVFHGASNPAWAAENLLGLAVTVAFITLTLVAARDLTPPVLLYCLAFWATVLCAPQWMDGYYAPFSSVDRFVLALFPLAPWVALRLADKQLRVLQTALGVLYVGATSVFLTGGWVG